MKLSRAFLGIAATALAVLPVAFAQAQTSGVGNAALAAEKQIATALATAAVNVLTAFEQKVQNASNLTSATQQAIVSSMNTTIAQLNSYKTTIAAVTTQSDLTSANQQLQSYIAGHKTIVEQNFQLAMEDLASQLVTRTNAFYINAQALVPQLQTACPSQASLIASTEASWPDSPPEWAPATNDASKSGVG